VIHAGAGQDYRVRTVKKPCRNQSISDLHNGVTEPKAVRVDIRNLVGLFYSRDSLNVKSSLFWSKKRKLPKSLF
jgi:hypothetical protein